MALTSEERAILQTRLTDAEQQLHLVVTGQAARVFVDQNGERIEYTAANRGSLQAYIMSLKSQLGKLNIAGPMRVWF
jgi:hypothetical protein